MDSNKILDNYLYELSNALSKFDKSSFNFLVDQIIEISKSKGRIYICGNGGSASTASHFVVDIMKGVLASKKNVIDVTCLNDNTAILTAYSNDLSYDQVYSYQIIDRIRSRDMLIVISGSGNSQNIVNVIETAIKSGSKTFGLLGFDGGKVGRLIDNKIIVNSSNMQIIEDIHLIIVHILLTKLNSMIVELN